MSCVAYVIGIVVVCLGVQTPNCIRQTVFDAVALDYRNVSVIVDATAAATPDIHAGMFSFTLLKHQLYLRFVLIALVDLNLISLH